MPPARLKSRKYMSSALLLVEEMIEAGYGVLYTRTTDC